MKLLIVDDELINLSILEAMLIKLGHTVCSMNDPKQTLDTFRQAASISEPFDAVITDFNMPIWSGITLALHIRSCCTAYNIKIPVICVTGNPEEVIVMNKRDRLPFTAVLGKPYDLDALKTILERNVNVQSNNRTS